MKGAHDIIVKLLRFKVIQIIFIILKCLPLILKSSHLRYESATSFKLLLVKENC